MKNVGICGSDLHFLDTGRLGPKVATQPFVLGHEGAGVIEAVGEAVKHLEIGMLITMAHLGQVYCNDSRFPLMSVLSISDEI
jgi:D-arabinose 1-dehydrogenase-like Zn-dependent alcohol dehydrogenase